MASTKTMRDRLRVAHLAEGTLLAAYIYTPLGDMAGPQALVRFALVPAMVVSGVVMWQLPTLRSRWRRARDRGVARAA